MSLHIAVDLGGTTARVAGYESLDAREWLGIETFEVQKVGGGMSSGEKHRSYLTDLRNLRLAIERMTQSPLSISLAVAGKVDNARTALRGAGNLVHWVGEPITRHLHSAFGCPVVLGNDAEAAALAEALHGHGQGKDFLTMIWGTGVGGCAIYWRDGLPHPYPMEPGHIQTRGIGNIDPYPCGCGRSTCLESYCGGDNILRHEGGSYAAMSYARWSEYAELMADGVADILILHSALKVVAFTGGVACNQEWLLPDIEVWVCEQKMLDYEPEVKLSVFGESAGTHGALALGRRLLNGPAPPVSR